MSRFSVTTAELNNVVNTLSSDNQQFRARVNDLMVCAQELAAMWQGEANTRFNNALNTDQERWSEFAMLIDQYSQALGDIIRIYSNAEMNNTSTATTRTY